MGPLEEKILQCLIVDGRVPFRRIAEVVGASEQTVGRRYRSMRDGGLARVVVRPSGYSTSRRAWWVQVRCRPDAANGLADSLADRDDAGWVALVSGGAEVVCRIAEPVTSASDGVLGRLPRSGAVLSFSAQVLLRPFVGTNAQWSAFDHLLGDDEIAHLRAGATARAATPAALTADDQPLLAALAADGRASVTSLAERLAWPASRVAARIDGLLASGEVFVATDHLPEAFGYHASAILHLSVPPGRIVEVGEALARHPATGFVAATSGASTVLAAVTCRSYDDLFRFVTEDVGSLPEVHQLDMAPYFRRVKQSSCRVVDGRLVSPPP